MVDYRHPDLTQHPPRSPRVRLGGFAHLPRLLDKARALAAGKNGLYEYGAMMDRHFIAFTGIDAPAFLEAVKTGRLRHFRRRGVRRLRARQFTGETLLYQEGWREATGCVLRQFAE